MHVRAEKCDRAREYASRRLDGELGELEGYLLRAHLGRCMECRDYEAAISAQTEWLRSQELEPLTQPVSVPRRRVRAAALRNRSAVGAAFALAVIGSLHAVDVLRTHQVDLVPEARSVGPSATLDREFRNVRRANLATRQLGPSMLRQVAASE